MAQEHLPWLCCSGKEQMFSLTLSRFLLFLSHFDDGVWLFLFFFIVMWCFTSTGFYKEEPFWEGNRQEFWAEEFQVPWHHQGSCGEGVPWSGLLCRHLGFVCQRWHCFGIKLSPFLWSSVCDCWGLILFSVDFGCYWYIIFLLWSVFIPVKLTFQRFSLNIVSCGNVDCVFDFDFVFHSLSHGWFLIFPCS